MKKLLAVGFLSLAMLGVATAPAPALFHHCCDKCCSYICCRQYNAFTPVCFGNMTCVGCCPFGSCGLNAPGYPAPPNLGYGDGCCDTSGDGCCGDGAISGTLPPVKVQQGNKQPPTFTPPMPTPMDGNPMPTSMYRPMSPWGNRVMPAGYQPMGYPGMNPGYWPQMPAGTMPMYNPMAPQGAMNAFSGGY